MVIQGYCRNNELGIRRRSEALPNEVHAEHLSIIRQAAEAIATGASSSFRLGRYPSGNGSYDADRAFRAFLTLANSTLVFQDILEGVAYRRVRSSLSYKRLCPFREPPTTALAVETW